MHGMLDYPAGILLIASPWIFGFSDVGNGAAAIPIVIGALIIVQSLMTDYELSLANVISMRVHLLFDVMTGLALASAPFISGDHRRGGKYWLPHVTVGLAEVAGAAMTRRERLSKRSTTARFLRALADLLS